MDRFIKRSGMLALVLMLGWVVSCHPPCHDASPSESCPALRIVALAPKISRTSDPIILQVENLDAFPYLVERLSTDYSVVVTLASKSAPTVEVPLRVVSSTLQAEPNSKVSELTLTLDNAAALVNGPANLKVCVGIQCVQRDILINTPPQFMGAYSRLSHLDLTTIPLAVNILPPESGKNAGSVFVSERDNISRLVKMCKYNYAATTQTLALDTLFFPMIVFAQVDNFLGLFGVSGTATFSHQYASVPQLGYYMQANRISPFANGTSTLMAERSLTRPRATIFTADPVTLTRMIVDPLQIDVFELDYSVPYKPITSLATVIPLSYLVARHQDLDVKNPLLPTEKYFFDAVGVDQNQQIQIYQLSGASLSVSETFSQAANDALQAGIGLSKLVGFSVYDLDQDGYPDLVFALQSPDGTVLELGWVGYLGQGQFAPLVRTQLAGPVLQGARSMAVGDLDADGRADVVFVDATGVQGYLNKAL